MKKIIITISYCLFTTMVFSQIPSIREKRVIITPRKVPKENIQKEFIFPELFKQDLIDSLRSTYRIGKDGIKTLDSILSKSFQKDLKQIDQYFEFNDNGTLINISTIPDPEFLKRVNAKIDTIQLVYYEYYQKKIDTLKKDISNRERLIKKVDNIDEITKGYSIINNKKKFLEQYEDIVKEIEDKNFEDEYTQETNFLPTLKKKIIINSKNGTSRTITIDNKEVTFDRIFSKRKGSNFYFANNAGIQINGSGTILESELVSAYLGAFRVSFGSLITNSDEEEEDNMMLSTTSSTANNTDTDNTEAFQRLLEGGGNVFLNLELPLFFYQSDLCSFYWNAASRIGLEISEFSDEIDSSTGNGSLTSNFYASVSTDEREFTFFANINYGLYFGAEDFYNRLNIQDQNAFWFGKLTTGVTIQNRLRFSLTLNTFSSEENLRSGTIVIGAQILSGLFE